MFLIIDKILFCKQRGSLSQKSSLWACNCRARQRASHWRRSRAHAPRRWFCCVTFAKPHNMASFRANRPNLWRSFINVIGPCEQQNASQCQCQSPSRWWRFSRDIIALVARSTAQSHRDLRHHHCKRPAQSRATGKKYANSNS